MGAASSGKEQRRNLKNQVDEVAAAAVADLRTSVMETRLQHQVLARQMLAFETEVAKVRESRAIDRKLIETQGIMITELLARSTTDAAAIEALWGRIWKLERPWWRTVLCWFGTIPGGDTP